jgi:hypothetical protein
VFRTGAKPAENKLGFAHSRPPAIGALNDCPRLIPYRLYRKIVFSGKSSVKGKASSRGFFRETHRKKSCANP